MVILPIEIPFQCSNRTLHEDVYSSSAGVFFRLLLEEGNRLAAAFKEMLGLAASQLTWKSHVMPLSQGDKRL